MIAQQFDGNLASARGDFQRDGFVVLRQFLSPNELSDLKAHLDRYIREATPRIPPTDVMYEDKSNPETLKQLARIKMHDGYFANLITSEKWKGLAELLLDDDVTPLELEWFNKPPRVGKPTPPHQDGYYFMLEPNEAVTMWLALDDVDESNGCMRYIAGSHRTGMRSHARTQVLGFSQGISDYSDADRAAEIPLAAKPGDLLAHHSLTIHRADANPSSRHRRSLGFVYFSARARQNKEQLANYQEKLYKELEAAKKI
jgi:phytanoyl-CoA hydroxylase